MRTLAVASALGASLLAGTALHADDVMVVYDASGSMWGQIEGVSKIEIAREVMGDLLDTWPEDTNLGLVAYGHRQEGVCSDIETVVPVGPVDRNAFRHVVDGINPLGRTPLSAAVEHAATELSWRETPATVVLISDGIENCEADPCALSARLAEQGIAFTAHVIGFDLDTDEHQHLSCIAENTGGLFLAAQDATELAAAVRQVGAVITEQPPQSEPVPEPEPAPVPDVVVTGPEATPVGSRFAVEWNPTHDTRDIITIVPAGSNEGTRGNWQRAGSSGAGELTAPAEPGLYELRYMLNEGRGTLGSAPIEVTDAAVTVSGPESVTTGARFSVTWDQTIATQDIITIVPAGSDEGTRGNWQRVGSSGSGELTAPAEPGLYELRYVLNEGQGTLGSAPIEVTDAAVTVSGPESVTTGARFSVTWDQTIATQDIITIVPAGSDEGARGNWRRVGSSGAGELSAPAEPGLYELRYVLNEGQGTLASRPIEVVEAETTIEGPDRAVRAGSEIAVRWSQTIATQDLIAVVPLGADESERGRWRRAGNATDARISAPDEVGLYEIRYILNVGHRVLASHTFEVVPADAPLDAGAGLSVPERVSPGERFTVTWEANTDGARIALARADQADFTWIDAQPANAEGAAQFTAPDGQGNYEVRFLDIANQAVLGRAIVVVE